MKVRVKFSKTGVMKYIGHLDVMRYFQKALRRAGFDTALSGGFSPHMIMSFAAPLGVGITSEGEYFDLELRSAGSSEEMEAALNAVMAEGIQVRSIKQIPDDKKAGGMRLLAAADYLVSTKDSSERGTIPVEKLSAAVPMLLARDSLVIEKKTKKGSRMVDIRPLIYRLETRGDSIFMQISQGSTDNLRPELVMQALCSEAGIRTDDSVWKIHRVELYADCGTEETHDFRSLESLGETL